MEQEFIAFVAGVFGVPDSQISLDTKYKEFDRWDSLMMLTLTMELEAQYNVSISIEQIEGVKALRDLYDIVTSN